MLNIPTFNKLISGALCESRNPFFYTYIAISTSSESVYKIGMSRNPLKRRGGLKHYAGQLGFEVLYFLPGNIEYSLIHALTCSGIEPVIRNHHPKSRNSEALYISPNDIRHIVDFCGFTPIQNFQEQKSNGNE